MRIGFVPLLFLTAIVGAGGGAAYAAWSTGNRAPTQPQVAIQAPAATPAAEPAAGAASPAGGQRPGAGGAAGGAAGGPAGGAARPGGPGGQAGGGAANAAGGPGGVPAGLAGRAVNGTVSRIEGNTIILTTPQGESTVTLAEGVTVQRSVPASVTDIKPGDRILVGLRPGNDNTTAAATIQIVTER